MTFQNSDEVNIKNFIKRKVNGLLVPYMFYAFVGMVWKAVYARDIYFNIELTEYNGPIWFFEVLFFMYLLLFGLMKVIKSPNLLVVCAIWISVATSFLSQDWNFYIANIRMKSILVSSGYMAIGIWYSKQNWKMVEDLRNVRELAYALILGSLGFGLASVNEWVKPGIAVTGNIFIYYISATCSIGMMVILGHFICGMYIKKLLEFWGRNTRIILGTHWMIFVMVTHAIKESMPEWNRTFVKLPVVLLIESLLILGVNEIKKWRRTGICAIIGKGENK